MAYRYTTEVRHEGLGKYRVISGTDYDLVQAKARAQCLEWDRKYNEVLAKNRKKEAVVEARETARRELEESLQEAEDRTREAQREIETVMLGGKDYSPRRTQSSMRH
jgi:restriction system protein